MKVLVAISAILMVSNGQILSYPPPSQASVISASSPLLWYPTFSPGSVSLSLPTVRTDLGSCPDDMIQVLYLIRAVYRKWRNLNWHKTQQNSTVLLSC